MGTVALNDLKRKVAKHQAKLNTMAENERYWYSIGVKYDTKDAFEEGDKKYGTSLRISGNESDEELMRKITARKKIDDEDYLEEKETENKMRAELKAKRVKTMGMTVKEMTALLKENGKSGYSGKKKAELIEMIEKYGLNN